MPKVIIKTIQELKEWRKEVRNDISFIPTMGNLHKGHEKLIQSAKYSNSNIVIVSIFINPLQFEDKKDLENYPKTIDRDIKLAFQSGADAIFIPTNNEIFPKNNKNIIFINADLELSSTLCGIKRQGHFDGVCTVIFRFINLINPQIIFLGEKDWQQLLIIKNMIQKMKLKIQIKSVATQRDNDGVPCSSRNNHLSITEKRKYIFFSNQLINAKRIFEKEENIDLKTIIKTLKNNNINLEYLEHVDAFTLQKATKNRNLTFLAGAIVCGNTRLIDHVFLMTKKPIIAIDGPAGSGKSTVTKLIAKKLKFTYLDTGAMYRALCWYFLIKKIDYKNIIELKKILKEISIVFKTNSDNYQDIYINNNCVTEEIRTPKINSLVSSVASINEVREYAVAAQQKIGKNGGIVAEGRDIATKVFPEANLKIFLTASIDERANRRKLELEAKGYKDIHFNELKEQIEKRDSDDSNREVSPLIKANDAIEIHTDGKSIQQITEQIISFYDEIIPKELRQ